MFDYTPPVIPPAVVKYVEPYDFANIYKLEVPGMSPPKYKGYDIYVAEKDNNPANNQFILAKNKRIKFANKWDDYNLRFYSGDLSLPAFYYKIKWNKH